MEQPAQNCGMQLKQTTQVGETLRSKNARHSCLSEDTDAMLPLGTTFMGEGHSRSAFGRYHPVPFHSTTSNENHRDTFSAAIQDREGGQEPGQPEMSTGLEPLCEKGFRIGIKTSDRILLIDSADVIAVEAQGNYVLMRQRTGSLRVRGSISELARHLEPRGFIRVHRSILLNGRCVQEIRQSATGDLVLNAGGREYRVSRTYRKNLKAAAQVWVGLSSFKKR